MNQEPSRFDYVKLHFVILVWGFTAVLGKLIELPALEITFLRTGLAAGLMAIVLRQSGVISVASAIPLLANGALIGLHWVLFFAATKVSSISVCMIGMATTSLWTAIFEPLLDRTKPFCRRDFGFGLIIIFAVLGIYWGETRSVGQGLALAIPAAIVAAIFSVFNGRLAQRHDFRVIVLYEMAGSTLFCGVTLLILTVWNAGTIIDYGWPAGMDWFWLFILSSICTVYAFGVYVELLRRLSVFTINFATNLEPIYGILLGAILFGEHGFMGTSFTVGSIIILAVVVIQPFVSAARDQRT